MLDKASMVRRCASVINLLQPKVNAWIFKNKILLTEVNEKDRGNRRSCSFEFERVHT